MINPLQLMIIALLVAGMSGFSTLTNRPEHISQIYIGYTTQERPIESFTFGTGSRHVIIVGGIHGGYEWNTVALAYLIAQHYAKNFELIPRDVSLTIIPSLNPDGMYALTPREGRFNGRGVDLNRNFDCKWQSRAQWGSEIVSGGTEAFSEPEARAFRDMVVSQKPSAVIFLHSAAGAVYGSECYGGVLPETNTILSAYSEASGYPRIESFDNYVVTGDAEGWLASIGIPAITVELTTHEDIELERNLEGVQAVISTIVSDFEGVR